MKTKEIIYDIDKRVVVSGNEEKEIKMKDKIKKFYKDYKIEIKAFTIVALVAGSYYSLGRLIGYNKGYEKGYYSGKADMCNEIIPIKNEYLVVFEDQNGNGRTWYSIMDFLKDNKTPIDTTSLAHEIIKEITDASKSTSIVD